MAARPAAGSGKNKGICSFCLALLALGPARRYAPAGELGGAGADGASIAGGEIGLRRTDSEGGMRGSGVSFRVAVTAVGAGPAGRPGDG